MFKKKLPFSLFLLSALIIYMSSCKNKSADNTSHDNWDKENLRGLNVEDTAYLNAIKQAQENIGLFTTFLLDKEHNGYDFYIKAKFAEAGYVEHLWLIVESLQEDTFIATLDNVPNKLKNVKYKDQLKIAKNEVEDWIVYEKDSLVLGNFISKTLVK